MADPRQFYTHSNAQSRTSSLVRLNWRNKLDKIHTISFTTLGSEVLSKAMSTSSVPLHSTIEAIGETPLIELARLTRNEPGRIFAKLEYLNPGFSKKDHNPAIRCYLIEPQGAAALAGEPPTYPNHRIQGGGYPMPELSLLDRQHVDGYLQVSDREAIETARLLAREEGIFAGFSSGANAAAALQLLRTELRGKTIVILMCDSGLKYPSADLWE